MSLHQIIFLIALLVPLSIDTFVLSAALGLAGLPKKQQFRTSLILAAFEGGMPIVGAAIGRGIGDALGAWTGYLAGAVIAVVGFMMIKPGEEEQHEKELKLMERTKGWKIASLGLAISIDGLAVGLSLGLIHVSLAAVVIGMVILAFAASMIGLRVGAILGQRMRDKAEMIAGIILIAVGLLAIILKALGHQL